MVDSMTKKEIDIIALVERALGSLSLFSVLLVFVAFGASKQLRTTTNWFIVCSCVANVFSAAAVIVAQGGIQLSSAGSDVLCQAQGFLLQTFTQSDPWWSFAMMINVFIVVTKGPNPDYFKKYWWLNCLICFGGPSISAVVLLVTGAFGDQGNWCWIKPEPRDFRVLTFFIPVWVCILGSLLIYTTIGIRVFRSRNQVRRLSWDGSVRHAASTRPSTSGQESTKGDRRSFLSLSDWPLSPFPGPGLLANLNATPDSPDAILPLTSVETTTSIITFTGPSPHKLLPVIREMHSPSPTSNQPSSGRRMREFGLNPRPAPIPPTPRPSRDQQRGTLQRAMIWFMMDDQVKRSYLQTAGLFAFVVLITWVPVSVFRMRQVFLGDKSFVSHLVIVSLLSLQGFWNCVLFFSSNRKVIAESIKNKFSPPASGIASLLAQPGTDVAAASKERDRQVRKTQMSIRIPWRRSRETERTYSWDFLDIGLEARGNVISISRGSRGTSILPSP
ncbi:hypothetical protein QBC44DRAFT_393718 [Cladorrhinum sp. PSN332]|nr:hypothetical protein QBC44DRAFT_393718 [Cladorrhinum sp. PSN332]